MKNEIQSDEVGQKIQDAKMARDERRDLIHQKLAMIDELFTGRYQMSHLRAVIDDAHETMDLAVGTMIGNPAYAIEWGDEVIDAALTEQLALSVIHALLKSEDDDGATFNDLVTEIQDRCISGFYEQKSTSGICRGVGEVRMETARRFLQTIKGWQKSLDLPQD